MAGVTISYNGNQITEISATGTRVLQTEGKYCTDDITVVYTALEDGDNLSYGSNTSNYVNAGAADYMII